MKWIVYFLEKRKNTRWSVLWHPLISRSKIIILVYWQFHTNGMVPFRATFLTDHKSRAKNKLKKSARLEVWRCSPLPFFSRLLLSTSIIIVVRFGVERSICYKNYLECSKNAWVEKYYGKWCVIWLDIITQSYKPIANIKNRI